MQFNTIEFAVFFLCVLIIFYIMPKKFRWIVLLIASGIFYLLAGINFLAYLGITILSTFTFGLGIDHIHKVQKVNLKQDGLTRDEKKHIKARYKRNRQYLVALNLLVNLGLLFFIKYFNFLSSNFSRLLSFAKVDSTPLLLELVLPLGISFYTFQTIGYIVDVYRGKYAAEKNIFKFALFVSFFPQIIQGPIGRFDKLSPQFFENNEFDYKRICYGLQLFLWGLFKKLVIADRINIAVNQVYDNWKTSNGVSFIIATALYSIQIYADFSGCMDMAGGVAETFGVQLDKNFDHPYFSKTMPEFWRRWHMTLGTWFKDYLFYPVSTSKFSQKLNKKSRKWFGNNAGRLIAGCFPIFMVWLSTGIWHGAELKYIVWGLFHGILIMSSLIFTPVNNAISDKLHIPREKLPFRIFQMIRTFILCCIGRVFFRSPSVSVSFTILKRVITDVDFSAFMKRLTYLNMGLDEKDWCVAAVSILLLWAVSLLQEKYKVRDLIAKRFIVVRWIIFYAAIFTVIVFGIYGPGYDASTFIYNQF